MLANSRIKKAYRKKALELHPDRNFGNAEEATKSFAEVQSAYEILSDPQERAWYDSHRESFLGADGTSTGDQYSYNTRMTTSDDIIKLFSRFTPGMEFSDSPTGFYGGLRETFAQLSLEEKLACQWEKLDFIDYPAFGTSQDDFEQVRPFYAAWSNFSTRKSFAWRDVYRLSEAPDRRVRRLMERENKRLREEGIRDFNDAVRALVAFVKKRDPRYKMNSQSEAQRQETLRQSAAAQAAKSRAINQEKLREHVVPDWVKTEEHEEDQEESSSDGELDHFECVVCSKSFKSQKQLDAHERSKKHMKAVKQLRWEMKMQDKQLNLDAAEDQGSAEEFPDYTEDSEQTNVNHRTVPFQSDDETGVLKPGNGTLDSNSMSLADPEAQTAASPADIDANALSNDDPSAETEKPEDDNPEFQDDSDYAPREAVEARLGLESPSDQNDNENPMHNSFRHLSISNTDEIPSSGGRKLGKAKQKRAKKAAHSGPDQSPELTCSTCSQSFSSRTQLFGHIKEVGHARPVLKTSAAKKGKSRPKR